MVNTLLKSPDTLTEQICARFREEIEAGKYAADDPLPSFGALADAYKISKSTVHEAFKTLAAEGFVFIKHGKGAFLNPARVKRRNGRKLADVALVAFNIFSANDNYMIPFLEAVNASALAKKIKLHFNFIRGMSLLSPENSVVREAVAHGQYDGLIIASPLEPRDLEWLTTLKVPFVAATSRYAIDVPQVLLDNTLAAKLAADIFERRGAKKLAVFTGPLSWEREGVTPYAKEIHDAFSVLKKEKGLNVSMVSCEYAYSDAREKALDLFSNNGRFDGLFFQSDIIAKGVMAALSEKKIDVSAMTIINYCDLEDYLAPVNIRKPLQAMGREAFALLESVLSGKEIKTPIILKPQLIEKEKKHG